MTRSIHRFMRAAWGKRFGEWHDVGGEWLCGAKGESGRFGLMVCFFFFFSFGRFRGCFIIRSLSVFVELYMN